MRSIPPAPTVRTRWGRRSVWHQGSALLLPPAQGDGKDTPIPRCPRDIAWRPAHTPLVHQHGSSFERCWRSSPRGWAPRHEAARTTVGPWRRRDPCCPGWGGLWCVSLGVRGEEGPPAGADVVVRVHADDSNLQFQGWLCRSPPTSGGKRHVRRSRGGLEMERAGPALKTPPRDHQQFFSWKQGKFNPRDLAAGSWSHGRCQEVLLQNIPFFFLIWKDKLLAFLNNFNMFNGWKLNSNCSAPWIKREVCKQES